MMSTNGGRRWLAPVLALLVVLLLAGRAAASIGDRSPEFRECVEICEVENCSPGKDVTPIPFLHRLLFWTCPSECDYTCQHIITNRRVARGDLIVQFHGKWPFHRVLGAQEPFSVLFSLGNLLAHYDGLTKLRAALPASYSLRPYYDNLAHIGILAWTLSAIFHTRDFVLTEQLDYFGAGASVLYGLYYTPVRIWRLDRQNTPQKRAVLKYWTWLCILLYILHVGYLKGVRWDYTYNMAANVAVGTVQNVLWSWFSYDTYRRTQRPWAVLPGFVVAWIILAMSLELLDFPPLWGCLDAHSLWHLGTIFPTVLWYNFLIKDAQDDIAGRERLKS